MCSLSGRGLESRGGRHPCVLFGQFGRKEIVVFDNMHFSFSRLKSSFVSMLTSWAMFEIEEDALVRILLCIL